MQMGKPYKTNTMHKLIPQPTNSIHIYTPKEITKEKEGTRVNKGKPLEIAHFDYYSGIEYAELKGLKFTTYFSEVFAGTHYIVTCGDVLVKVESDDFPEIKRREI